MPPRWFMPLALGLLPSCFPPGEGVEPPLDRLYFPVGLTVSPGATRLYVANSNFDLQYNGGALQAYDLSRLRDLVPRGCGSDVDCPSGDRCDLEPTDANGQHPSHWCVPVSGAQAGRPCGVLAERNAAGRLIAPGRCNYVNPNQPQDGSPSLVVAAVGIGAFATDVIYRSRPPGPDGTERPGGRLFIPVRGDATLHWIDVDDDGKAERTGVELACGQDRNDGDCDDAHRVGDDPDAENGRDLRLLPEPFAIDATVDGDAIVVTHQNDGAVSLFVNDWDAGTQAAPQLQDVAGGMPARVVGVASIPVAQALLESGATHRPGFMVTFRNAAELRILRYYADASSGDPSNPPRPYLLLHDTVGVTANSTGFDSRGIAIDGSQRAACEAACLADVGDERAACLETCRDVTLRVFVANRTPPSLLVGETRSATDDRPLFTDSIPMPYGPSRVVVGNVITPEGEAQVRVFILCFDSAAVGIYDPDSRRVEHWVQTGRGPHSFAVDTDPAADTGVGSRPGYALGYIGHFTDSYLGVIDLDQRNPRTYGEVVLTVGAPTAPRASK